MVLLHDSRDLDVKTRQPGIASIYGQWVAEENM